MRKGSFFGACALLGALLVSPAQAAGQTEFGAEALFGSDSDFGLGVRLQSDLGVPAPVDFQGGFAIFFPDGPLDYWELNGNAWYEFEIEGTNGRPYAGGGFNIGHRSSPGFSETDLGVNLGGGYRFHFTNTTPFVEARFTFGGIEQFVIGGGVTFRAF